MNSKRKQFVIVLLLFFMNCEKDISGISTIYSSYKIAFWPIQEPGLYLIDIRNKSQTLLIDSVFAYDISWHPSSKNIIYTYIYKDSDSSYYSLCSINNDGSGNKLLYKHNVKDFHYIRNIQYSSNGQKILFSSHAYNVEKHQIYIVNEDGTEKIKLSDGSGNDFDPKWSPDNSKIIFSSDRTGNFEIYTINPDGSNLKRLTYDTKYDHWYPSLSPDGTRLVFVKDLINSSWGQDSSSILCTLDMEDNTYYSLTVDSFYISSPAWSPIDSRIAFLRPDWRIQDQVWIIDSDGGNERQLTSSSSRNSATEWLSDGSKLISMTRNPDRILYLLDPTSKSTDKIMTIPESWSGIIWATSPLKL